MHTGKKLTTMLLLIAMLLPLASCGGTTEETTGTSETTATETVAETETELTTELPDTDWGGQVFTGLGLDHQKYDQFDNFEIDVEELNGEVVNDAIYNRNLTLEQRYNVVIAQHLESSLSSNAPVEVLKNITLAGDALYDVAFAQMENIGGAVTQGYYQNMIPLPYMDFEKPWWNKEVNDAISVHGKLFFTSSDFSLRDKSRAYIMAVNRDMVTDHGLGDPIALVDEGKWTLDLTTQWVETVAQDVNGDGKMGDPTDIYGLVMDSYNGFAALMIGADNRVWAKDTEDGYVLSLNNEHTITSIDKIIALSCNTDTAFFCNDMNGKVDYDYWSASGNFWKAGNALFNTAFPHSLKNWSENCDFTYSIVPFPKMDEAQDKYHSLADFACMLFGIPAVAPDPEFAAFMLEALSYESMETSLPAYIETTCKMKYTYDEDSARMLDLIFDGIIYESAMIYNYNGIWQLISSTLPNKKQNVFVSEYEKLEAKENQAIEKMMETLDGLGQ